MIRLPWRRPPPEPEPSPELVRAVNKLAEETEKVAEQLARATAQRGGKPA